MSRRFRRSVALALVTAAVGAAGCGSDSGTTGQLSVRLTDAPGDYIQSATIWVSSIYLIGGTDPAGPRYTIASTPASYELTALHDGVDAALGTATIPVGDYTQMRLVVDRAEVTLKPGITIGGASTVSLQTPSAQRTGIKVNFSGPLHVAPGQTVLVVDFDVSRNFVFNGPAGAPNGVLFKPVLHATVTDIAGAIAGTASPASANHLLFAIVTPTGGLPDTVASAVADPATGAYILRYLDPRVSPFTVADSAIGYRTQQTTQVAVLAARTTPSVDFTLLPLVR